MANRAEQIQQILKRLVTNTPDVEGAAMVSTDGLTLASSLPTGVDEDRVAAMAAAVLALGERTALELQRGTLEQVYVKGSDGYVIMMQSGPDAVLEAIVGSAGKLGMVLLDMNRASKELANLL